MHRFVAQWNTNRPPKWLLWPYENEQNNIDCLFTIRLLSASAGRQQRWPNFMEGMADIRDALSIGKQNRIWKVPTEKFIEYFLDVYLHFVQHEN